MKVPNSDKVIIPKAKIEDYILSGSHPIGRNKSAFFNSLGFSLENQDDLITELKNIIVNNDLTNVIENAFGTKYVVKGLIITSKKHSKKLQLCGLLKKARQYPILLLCIQDKK